MKKSRRFRNEVNAGSMADIAFLLLIFFLVTTQIEVDKGILVKLPYWQDKPIITDVSTRNIFSIKVNRDNQLLVEGELSRVEGLRKQVKEFIMNPLQKQTLAVAPNKAVVALQNDRETSYHTYVDVYNEIKAAYRELWEAEARRRYGIAFVELTTASKNEIKNYIPSVISESEPTSY